MMLQETESSLSLAGWESGLRHLVVTPGCALAVQHA
jgi:hypothetical protein